MSDEAPVEVMKKRCAVFTVVKNEKYHLPIWLNYYKRNFPNEDIYVIDHQSDDGSTDNLDVNVVRVINDAVFDHAWLTKTVEEFQQHLLQFYQYVLFTDADELVVPNPAKYTSLAEYIDRNQRTIVKCLGYEIFNGTHWYANTVYNKPLLANCPLTWQYGYHDCAQGGIIDADLYLLHLKKLNYQVAWEKNVKWSKQKWDETALKQGYSIQNQMDQESKFKEWFNQTGPLYELPEWIVMGGYW